MLPPTRIRFLKRPSPGGARKLKAARVAACVCLKLTLGGSYICRPRVNKNILCSPETRKILLSHPSNMQWFCMNPYDMVCGIFSYVLQSKLMRTFTCAYVMSSYTCGARHLIGSHCGVSIMLGNLAPPEKIAVLILLNDELMMNTDPLAHQKIQKQVRKHLRIFDAFEVYRTSMTVHIYIDYTYTYVYIIYI